MEPDGLTRWMSSFDQAVTMEKLHEAVVEQGMTIVAQIDHAAAAAAAGLELRPTVVLLFGNALAGTPLMQAAPTVGIDLPLKALVWTDEEGATWLAYNDPSWLAARHGARAGNELVLATMRKVLATVADSATRRIGGPA